MTVSTRVKAINWETILTPDELKLVIGPPPVRNVATKTAPRPKPAVVAPRKLNTSESAVQDRLMEIKRDGASDPDGREIQAFVRNAGHGESFKLKHVEPRVLRGLVRIANTLDERSGPAAGYTAENVDVAEIYAISLVGADPLLRAGATVINRDVAVALQIPMGDDGTTEGAVVAMGSDAGTGDFVFSARMIRPFKFTSKRIIAPNELIRDGRNVPEIITGIAGKRIGRTRGRVFTSGGNGVVGILSLAGLGFTAASSTAVSPDEVFQLRDSLPSEYDNGSPSVGFMMSKPCYGAIRRLKDGAGQYVFGHDPYGQLMGSKVTFNRYMPSTFTTGTRPVLFGDFSQVVIVNCNNLRLMRYTENYAEKDQTAFEMFSEADMALLTPTSAYPPVVALQLP